VIRHHALPESKNQLWGFRECIKSGTCSICILDIVIVYFVQIRFVCIVCRVRDRSVPTRKLQDIGKAVFCEIPDRMRTLPEFNTRYEWENVPRSSNEECASHFIAYLCDLLDCWNQSQANNKRLWALVVPGPPLYWPVHCQICRWAWSCLTRPKRA